MSAPDADREPRRRVAAVRYDRGVDDAPRVVATGSGHVADRLLALAREAGVTVHEDAALAEALAKLQLDADIPPELYAAVAEALVWAYGLEPRRAGG
jgi:flagellar biosynthesis protein